MPFKDFMNKVRYWDHTFAKWMLRHVYLMFFQIVLLVVFFFWLFNLVPVVQMSAQPPHSHIEQILTTQSINTTIIVFLLILNSFWLLYIFSSMQRLGNLLRDLGYQLGRFKPSRDKEPRRP